MILKQLSLSVAPASSHSFGICKSNLSSPTSFSNSSIISCKWGGNSGISKLSISSQAFSSPLISQATAKGAATEHALAKSGKGISSHLHSCPAVLKHSDIIFPNFIASPLCSSVSFLSSFFCQSGPSPSTLQTLLYSKGSNPLNCSQRDFIFPAISTAVTIFFSFSITESTNSSLSSSGISLSISLNTFFIATALLLASSLFSGSASFSNSSAYLLYLSSDFLASSIFPSFTIAFISAIFFSLFSESSLKLLNTSSTK